MTVSDGTQINSVLAKLDDALTDGDVDAATALFAEECYWRDLIAFTWNITTAEGKSAIADMLNSNLERVRPRGWSVIDDHLARTDHGMSEGFFEFTTAVARGRGHIRVRDGQIFTLLTSMDSLNGHEEPLGFTRASGGRHGSMQAAPTWTEEREAESAALGVTTDPYVLVVGGGQNGIILSARLRQLGVPTIVVDKNERVGDNWRKRYKTLQLHNPIWENFFPYLDFPDDWPVFMHKDKFAEWLEVYTRLMQVNYWTSTEATSASYDDEAQRWSVTLNRAGEEVVLRPTHLVMATGNNGDRPNVPKIPGQDVFEGIQMHSSAHEGPEGLDGMRVVVIGAGTSAHDICAALALRGTDVTMVQRSSTFVVKLDSFMKYTLAPLYSAEAVERGLTAEKADLLAASLPFRLFFDAQKGGVDAAREADADFYEALKRTGFLLDFGPGGSGLFGKAITGAYNYYIDIGTSQLIIDGKIEVASGSEVKELTADSVVLADGRELPADVVIYATGFATMADTISGLMSDEVVDKVGAVWGIGSDFPSDPGPWEGELRNMWKPTAQDALWFQGSLIAHARFYSKTLALQLKARMEGIPTPVYTCR